MYKNPSFNLIKTIALILVFAFVIITLASVGNTVFAEVEVIEDSQTPLDALGFDSSALPEGYDPNTVDNPTGKENTVMTEIAEMMILGASTKSALYGHNSKLDGRMETFAGSAREKNTQLNPAYWYVSAAANFGATKKNMLALAEMTNNFDLALRIYDPIADSMSGRIELNMPKNPTQTYTTNYVQSLLSINTGDFDGDGVDEIAVFRPSIKTGAEGETNLPKVMFYHLKTKTSNPILTSSWELSWIYEMPPSPTRELINNVDLATGDVNGDGADEIIISFGASFSYGSNMIDPNITVPSQSYVLFGSKTGNMLSVSKKINIDDNKPENRLVRVSFVIEDINGDKAKDIVMGGQYFVDAVTPGYYNTTRVLGIFAYDQTKNTIVAEHIQNIKVVDGVLSGNDFRSNNGYDRYYWSMPAYKANLAVVELYGKSKPVAIYLDSVLYSYDGQFSIIDELDDQTKGDFPYYNQNNIYLEFGAKGGKFSTPDNGYLTNHRRTILPGLNNHEAEGAMLYAQNGKAYKKDFIKIVAQYYMNIPFLLCKVDTDADSAFMRYTGKHSLEYTAPKLLAVLASAPYFEDVANFDDGGGVKSSSLTSYGKFDSSSEGRGFNLSLNAGFHLEYSATLAPGAWGPGGYFDVGYAYSYSTFGSHDRTYTVTYNASAGEDNVVFFAIPMECFIYEVTCVDVDEEGNILGTNTADMVFAIPHQPAVRTMSIDDYEDVQKSFPTQLPKIRDNVIKSHPGDPASYPTSTQGLNDASVFAGDWAGVGFGNGSITQSISQSTTETVGGSKGGFFQGALGVGSSFLKLGGYFSISLSASWGETTINGSSFSGQVANMPHSAKDYGYYFAWKLLKHTFKAENGDNIPVITYLVTDVTTPPQLPLNFSQNHDLTTENNLGLQWETSQAGISHFELYRKYDFPIGGGNLKIASVSGGNYALKRDAHGAVITDERNRPIRVYTYVDHNLQAYGEYEYRIQTKRTNVPPDSIYSAPLKARTKAAVHPDIELSTDALTIYPDTLQKIELSIKNKSEFLVGSDNYQWYKFSAKTQEWEKVDGATKAVMPFNKSRESDAGLYRCLVNIIAPGGVSGYYISQYSKHVEVKFQKRTAKFGDVLYEQGTQPNSLILTVPVTNSGDTLSAPADKVTFTVQNATLQYTCTTIIKDGLAQITTDKLPKGAYEVSVFYGGNLIFSELELEEKFHMLHGVSAANFVDTWEGYKFGEDILPTMTVARYTKDGSGNVQKTDIKQSITKVDIVGKDGTSVLATFDPRLFGAKAYIPFDTRAAYSCTLRVYNADSETIPIATTHLKAKKLTTTLSLAPVAGAAGATAPRVAVKDFIITGDGELSDNSTSPLFTNNFTIYYYSTTGAYLFAGSNPNVAGLLPSTYVTRLLMLPAKVDYIKTFVNLTLQDGAYTLFGSYHPITASAQEYQGISVGTVSLLEPKVLQEVKDVSYPTGMRLVFLASPTNGFVVQQWVVSEDGVTKTFDNAQNIFAYTVQCDKSAAGPIDVRAVIVPKNNKLSYEVLGGSALGTLTSDSGIASGVTVLQGQKLSFTATPRTGYKFVEWRWINLGVNTLILQAGTPVDGSYKQEFTMGASSAALYAIFERETARLNLAENLGAFYINKPDINPAMADGREVAIDNSWAVPKGADVIVRPKPGYKTSGVWSAKSGPENDDLAFTLIEGGTAIKFKMPTAAGEASTATVGVATERGSYGIMPSSKDNKAELSVAVNGTTTANYSSVEGGSHVSVTANPIRGYAFSSWQINGAPTQTTSNVYSVNIMRNLNALALCVPKENRSLTLSTIGKGEGYYKITTQGGKIITGTFDSKTKSIPVYDGEKVELSAKPAANYYASYLIINGVRHINTSGLYVIESVSADSTIAVGFENSFFTNITFKLETPYKILDAQGQVIDTSKPYNVPIANDFEFTIDTRYQVSPPSAKIGDVDMTLTKDNNNEFLYHGKIENVKTEMTVNIRAFRTFSINTADKLTAFYNYLKANEGKANAVLTGDIDLKNWVAPVLNDTQGLDGVFDGAGHRIYGLHIGNASNYGPTHFAGLFTHVQGNGVIKNLWIDDFQIYSCIANYPSDSGILAASLFGIADNVIISNSTFLNHATNQTSGMTNVLRGSIQNCVVANVTFGEQGAGFYHNNIGGTLKNNYFYHPNSQNRAIKPFYYTANPIITSNNYYDIGSLAKVDCSVAENVYKTGQNPGAGYFAHTINKANNADIYGIAFNTALYPRPLAGVKNSTGAVDMAPRKVEFGKSLTKYVYPKDVVLPLFLGIAAWDSGTAVYSYGYKIPLLANDTAFSPIADISQYTGVIERDHNGKLYYKNSEMAFADFVAFSATGEYVTLNLYGAVNIDNNVTIGSLARINLKEGAILTIGENGFLNNRGAIDVLAGSVFYNYGIYQNGLLHLYYNGGKFINSGVYDGGGTIFGREYIICAPHNWGAWTVKTQPTPEAEGERVHTCFVCLKSESQTMPKTTDNPEPADVSSIFIKTPPAMIEYIAANNFAPDGISVLAKLKSGATANATTLSYAIVVDGVATPITAQNKIGEFVSTMGHYTIKVYYNGFQASYIIGVSSVAPAPKIVEIKQNSTIAPDPLLLNLTTTKTAELTANLGAIDDSTFIWTFADNSIVKSSVKNIGDTKVVIIEAMREGTTTLTVSSGNYASVSKTISTTVGNPATAISLLPEELTLTAGDKTNIYAIVTPTDCTSNIIWSTSDSNVVSITPAYAGNNKIYELSAISAGDATITATVDGISATCNVTVETKPTGISIVPTSLTLPRIGATGELIATITGGVDKVIWSASPAGVVRIDAGFQFGSNATATLTALKAGTTTITATLASDSTKKASCTVTVSAQKPAERVDIAGNNPRTIVIGESIGDELQLTATLAPVGCDPALSWYSSDESVLTVPVNGDAGNNLVATITPKKAGWATVVATAASGVATAVDVHVMQKATDISAIGDIDKTLIVGQEIYVQLNTTPVGSVGMVGWTSSDDTAVDVQDVMLPGATLPLAKITALATTASHAPVKITATLNSDPTKKVTYNITVKSEAIEISLDKQNIILTHEEDKNTAELTATLTPIDSTDVITWNVTSEVTGLITIEEVDGNNKIIKITAAADKVGKATIIAVTQTGHAAICYVVVSNPATAISLDPTTVTINKGDVQTIAATLTPAASTDDINWVSNNPSVATVDSSGAVSAVGAGSVTITATATSGVSATCAVTVTVPARSVTLDQTQIKLGAGGLGGLIARFTPIDTTDTPVWESSDTGVAVILNKSAITGGQQSVSISAISSGVATISVEINGKSAQCEVIVSLGASKITINYDGNPISGGTKDLKKGVADNNFSVTLDDDPDDFVEWSSSNSAILSISSEGLITPKKVGIAGIWVQSGSGMTDFAVVSVHQSANTLTLEDTSIAINTSKKLIPKITPIDCDDTFTWSSSDPANVEIDNTGTITGKSLGTSIITLTATDFSGSVKSATCTITVGISVTGVSLNKTATKLALAAKETLVATIEPQTAGNKNVTWASSDTSIAIVLQTGEIEALGAGETTITVTTQDGGFSATCITTVYIPVQSVSLDYHELTVNRGESKQLTATVLPFDATDKSVIWSSSNPAVATVNTSGEVRAISGGEAIITVTTTDGNKTDVCAVSVPNVAVTGITLNKKVTTIIAGKTETLIATILPENASDVSVTWSSNNEKVAIVQSGVVSTKVAGYVTITATTADGKFSASCAVTVAKPVFAKKITIGKVGLTRYTNISVALTATVSPSNTTNKTVTWSSSNTNIATVMDGLVSFIAPGKVTIKATAADGSKKSASVKFTVRQIVLGVEITNAPTELMRTQKFTLKAVVAPTNATAKSVIWHSSDKSIAAVSSKGFVVAKKTGVVVITAKAKDGSGLFAQCVIKITPLLETSVKLSKTAITVAMGKIYQLIATVSPSNTDFKSVVWSCSDEAVATVDAKGKVVAIGSGTCVVTVTTQNGKTATCTVTVK